MLPFPLRLVAAIAVGLLLTACGGAANQAASQPIKPANLKTATVQRQAVADEVMFDGTLEALHQSTVASETNARVTELPFDVNDFVKQGEVIVRFRDTDQKARLASAEAALSGANAHYTDARLEQERIQQLYEKKLVPKSQMDSANAAMESAKAQVDAAIAGKKQAAEQLEHTVVRAPYSGIVLARHIHVGETATVGQPLMTGCRSTRYAPWLRYRNRILRRYESTKRLASFCLTARQSMPPRCVFLQVQIRQPTHSARWSACRKANTMCFRARW